MRKNYNEECKNKDVIKGSFYWKLKVEIPTIKGVIFCRESKLSELVQVAIQISEKNTKTICGLVCVGSVAMKFVKRVVLSLEVVTIVLAAILEKDCI